MFGRGRNQVGKSRSRHGASWIEPLESRRLLSAVADAVLRSDAEFLHPAASSSSIQGYTPSEIRHAYGFDNISLSGGTAADGRGQTIAIVDAYNDPNIASDLTMFDNQFGLAAAPSLKVVNQSGGTALPNTDAGWAGEIALDVEWAHAIAPRADILLVEANSATVQDLMSAVNYARHAAGVSVVSMSWGGSEFFSWNGGEFTGQTDYDPIFTTPAGHQGVTFIAAAGDSGSFSGVEWPASSSNVLSVGGTSLFVQDQSGTYSSESGWRGTSGGYSQIEAEPTWQQAAQSSGARSTPDVAYDGDPNTGFAVYDSVANQGLSGWEEVGGTSAGAPQWAALVAIADQARALAGRGSLDGATQTLPLLYSLYTATDSTGASTYNSYFNDVVDSGGGGFHWRFGGLGFGNAAQPGYDTATGLGTPIAAGIVTALAGPSSSSSGSGSNTGGSGGNNGSTSTPAQLPASPITGTFTTSPRASVIGGTSGVLKLKLTNTGSDKFSGPLSIDLNASTDGSLSADDTFITTISLPKVTLRAGASRTVRLKFDYPSDAPDGTYKIIASINATDTNTAPATAVTRSAVMIAAPFVDLSTGFGSDQPVTVNPGHSGSATVTIQNLGNVTASGTIDLNLYASADQTLDASDMLIGSMTGKTIRIRPGKSITLHVRFDAPLDAGGTYNVIASLTSNAQPGDSNSSNDVAVTGTR